MQILPSLKHTQTQWRKHACSCRNGKASPPFFPGQIYDLFHLINCRCEAVLLPAPGKVVQWWGGNPPLRHLPSILSSTVPVQPKLPFSSYNQPQNIPASGMHRLCNLWAGSSDVNSTKSAPLTRRSEEIELVYIIDLLQQWWLCRAWAATRFASLKQKFCKASVRRSTNILLLTSV